MKTNIESSEYELLCYEFASFSASRCCKGQREIRFACDLDLFLLVAIFVDVFNVNSEVTFDDNHG